MPVMALAVIPPAGGGTGSGACICDARRAPARVAYARCSPTGHGISGISGAIAVAPESADATLEEVELSGSASTRSLSTGSSSNIWLALVARAKEEAVARCLARLQRLEMPFAVPGFCRRPGRRPAALLLLLLAVLLPSTLISSARSHCFTSTSGRAHVE